MSAESGYRRIVHNCPSGIGNMKKDSVYIKKNTFKTVRFVLISIPCFCVGLHAFHVGLNKS